MESFVYAMHPARVLFGSGTICQLPSEVERLGLQRVLVLSTPQQAEEAQATMRRIGPRAVAVFIDAAMHTPVDVTAKALIVVEQERVDGIVACGGGSTTGLSKAIALRTDLPQIVVPTTYAGSEMTPLLGETEHGAKVTQSSPRVLPEVVIYDVDLTLGLPVPMSIVSGMNAIAHAVEALYSRDRNPVTDMMAVEGIRVLSGALPRIRDKPQDVKARSDALYGAWLCGICLGAVGMALHHKLCHTLGGAFDLPHAETHTAVLPHAMAYNAAGAPDAMAAIARALGVADAPRGLYNLANNLGATMALSALGLSKSGVDEAADLAMANPYWNPCALDRAAIRSTIARAHAGRPPRRP